MTHHLAFRRYALPLRAPVRTAHGRWDRREGLIVRVEDAAGRVGYGEAAPVSGFGRETVAEDEAACRALGDAIDAAQVEALPPGLGALRQALRAALAPAEEDRPPARDALPVAALLPAGRPALDRVGPLGEAGFRTFKWKVGVGDIADELGLLDDLIARLPPGARLRLDANGAWDRRTAERWLARCADRPVEHVEQPVAAEARGADDLLLGLASDYPTPLALDESLVGAEDLDRWLGAGWPGVYVLKLSLIENPAAALARLAGARASVVLSSALETAVGAQAALRAAFAWSGAEAAKAAAAPARALGFGVWPLFADARFDGPAAAPFIRAADVARLDPEAVWNALS